MREYFGFKFINTLFVILRKISIKNKLYFGKSILHM